MCGISGVLNFKERAVQPGILQKMIGMIHHRGPDDTGIYTDGPMGLAHARLSIIDLGGGHQPMSNQDRTLWISFNGEIFNYLEIKQELIKMGHRFATSSDTEVILHLYQEKGEACVNDLNGQWAFAIWDQRRQRLFISRDRLGVRPLFYTLTDRSLIFASEIKSIFAHPDVAREVDPVGLDQIFTFWSTIPPKSIFKGIMELPPGHSILFSDGKISIKTYWEIGYPLGREALFEGMESEQEVAGQLMQILRDAVRIRLRSDVPVGAYLSGGLDSSIITALAAKLSNKPIETFSVTFEDPEFNERDYQRETVNFLRTKHQEIHCTYQDIQNVFPGVIWHTEKPVIRTAPAPLYLLSKLVRKSGYKVVLTGEGADEMLGGYDIFKEAKIRRFWSTYPDSRRRPLLLKKLYPYMQNIQSQPEAYLKAFFHIKTDDLSNPLFSHLPRWELTSRLKLFYSDYIKSELKGTNAFGTVAHSLPEAYSKWDHFSQSQYLETKYLLPGYVLSSQGDRMAMAHSVEGRFPFLDHPLVEFAAKIPSRLKMKVLNEKYILKLAAGDLIPSRVRNRYKQPYRAPDARSFFSKETPSLHNGYVEELLSFKRIEKDGLFNPHAVEKLVEKGKKNQLSSVKDNMAFVGILSSQLLVDQFINQFNRRANDTKC
jgi:asparagine synthase (glutamine-hydrolysing)